MPKGKAGRPYSDNPRRFRLEIRIDAQTMNELIKHKNATGESYAQYIMNLINNDAEGAKE